jgi:hypothetical protein
MAIPSQQLEAWSHGGATVLSADAYARIQTALTKSGSPLSNVSKVISLQGSYGNDTHTRGDSDIDVVVRHENYFYDTSRLSPDHLRAFQANFFPATYKWEDYKRDVIKALAEHFGNAQVVPGHKAIKVQTGVGRMTADVIPAFEHRTYTSFADAKTNLAHYGIKFLDARGGEIINYPRHHIERGAAKNTVERTGGAYKPTIRLFKNFRSWLVENHRLGQDVAPSYYLECMLHNVPDALFVGDFTDTVPSILSYLWTTPYESFLSQNGLTLLFGTGPTQWSGDNFTAFLAAARAAWDNW